MTALDSAIDARPVLPYPDGWFALCLSHELKAGTVLTAVFMGRELVLYRTASGLVRIADPHCPHLGAHLGHGGRVEGEHLVCPFHGLAFDPQGHCARAAGGQTPPKAALHFWPALEINGAVFVWQDHAGRPPWFELPAFDFEGFSVPRSSSYEPTGYVQDMVENTADMAHFPVLHGFTDTTMTHRADGHRITFELSGHWKGARVRMCFTSYGLGYTEGESEVPGLGVRVKTLSFASPIVPLRWKFRWSDAVRISKLDALPGPLRRAVYATLSVPAHRWFAKVASADFGIWNHRQYVARPKLMAGEASIAALRRWSAQFYPSTEQRLESLPTRDVVRPILLRADTGT